jgi:hypothetical protein
VLSIAESSNYKHLLSLLLLFCSCLEGVVLFEGVSFSNSSHKIEATGTTSQNQTTSAQLRPVAKQPCCVVVVVVVEAVLLVLVIFVVVLLVVFAFLVALVVVVASVTLVHNFTKM